MRSFLTSMGVFFIWPPGPYDDACPDFRKALEKYVQVGDLDQSLAAHLKVCKRCSEVADKLRKKP